MGEGKTDVGGVEVGLRAAFSNFTSTSLQRLWSPLELGPVFLCISIISVAVYIERGACFHFWGSLISISLWYIIYVACELNGVASPPRGQYISKGQQRIIRRELAQLRGLRNVNMSRPFPYTYISCPCADTPVPDPARKRRSRESPQKPRPEDSSAGANDTGKDREDKRDTAEELEEVDEEEERTFDPRSPRSNFSLYPPEQLLYCEDCHQIKCPRCITEEIVCWYCPHCLFETPSSMVRSEGNR